MPPSEQRKPGRMLPPAPAGQDFPSRLGLGLLALSLQRIHALDMTKLCCFSLQQSPSQGTGYGSVCAGLAEPRKGVPVRSVHNNRDKPAAELYNQLDASWAPWVIGEGVWDARRCKR